MSRDYHIKWKQTCFVSTLYRSASDIAPILYQLCSLSVESHLAKRLTGIILAIYPVGKEYYHSRNCRYDWVVCLFELSCLEIMLVVLSFNSWNFIIAYIISFLSKIF
jgi:hypothetical protein